MEFTAKQIAELIQGEIVGNPEERITSVSKIEEGKPGALTFLSNLKYSKFLYSTTASVVIVDLSFEPEEPVSVTLIKVPDAYQAIAILLELYDQAKPQKSGIEMPSFVHESASLGEFVYVGAFAYIGENVKLGKNVKIYPQTYIGDNVTIGDDSIVFAGVKVYNDCKIGSGCIVHAGAVIGSDGFGFAPDKDGKFKKIPQIGNVILEDGVEIGANTTLDRATMGSTVISRGAKLDNLIQIAHNVTIGENCVIAAHTGIAGSTKVGDNCMIGGQVAIAGHITLANNTKLAAMSGVTKSIKKEGVVHMGAPSFDVVTYNKAYVIFKRLPEMYKQLLALEKKVEDNLTK